MSVGNQSTELKEIKDGLRSLIVERLKLDIDPSSIQDQAPLFGAAAEGAEAGLALDSVEALEIVVGIEEKWGVVIEDDSVANEFFSLETLSGLVQRLLTTAAPKEEVASA
jgi:acyl carrier protein